MYKYNPQSQKVTFILVNEYNIDRILEIILIYNKITQFLSLYNCEYLYFYTLYRSVYRYYGKYYNIIIPITNIHLNYNIITYITLISKSVCNTNIFRSI